MSLSPEPLSSLSIPPYGRITGIGPPDMDCAHTGKYENRRPWAGHHTEGNQGPEAVKEFSYAGGTACATTTTPAWAESQVGQAVPPASPACGRFFHSFPVRAAPQCGGGVPPGQRVDHSQEGAPEVGAQEVERALQRELPGSWIFVRRQVYR